MPQGVVGNVTSTPSKHAHDPLLQIIADSPEGMRPFGFHMLRIPPHAGQLGLAHELPVVINVDRREVPMFFHTPDWQISTPRLRLSGDSRPIEGYKIAPRLSYLLIHLMYKLRFRTK